jgi:Tol biopolymer transport system component
MRTALCAVIFLTVAFPLHAQEEPKQITFGERKDVDPAVSPDGKHLVYSSDRTGSFNIFMITFGTAGDLQLTQGKKDDRHPAWSPDSKKVVFTSKRTGNGDLYEMACDGSAGFLQLTDREEIETTPCYSPKETGLAFGSAPKKAVQFSTKMSVVFAKDKGGANNCTVLTDGGEPRISPDGKKIVFVSHRTKNKDIWLMNIDGGQQMQLTSDPKDDENPAFSPDGKRIVFVSNRTGNCDLWVMDADGSNPRQLTTDPAQETQPYWSPENYLYYVREAKQGQSNIFRIKAP